MNSAALLASMLKTSYDSKCGDPPVKKGHLVLLRLLWAFRLLVRGLFLWAENPRKRRAENRAQYHEDYVPRLIFRFGAVSI